MYFVLVSSPTLSLYLVPHFKKPLWLHLYLARERVAFQAPAFTSLAVCMSNIFLPSANIKWKSG